MHEQILISIGVLLSGFQCFLEVRTDALFVPSLPTNESLLRSRVSKVRSTLVRFGIMRYGKRLKTWSRIPPNFHRARSPTTVNLDVHR